MNSRSRVSGRIDPTCRAFPGHFPKHRLKPQDSGKPSDSRALIVKVRLEEPVPLELGQRVEVEIAG